MKNFLVLLLAITAILTGTHSAAAQTPVVLPFNPDYSYQDVRVEFGLFKSIREDDVDTRFFQAAFSRMFWNKLAWKAGFLYKGAGAEYKSMVGVPLGLSYRTGSLTLSEALEYSTRQAAYDSVRRTIDGNLDGLGRDLLADLLLILFRRSELFIGLTPGYYMGDRLFADETPGSRFHLSVDAGVVLSIPIRRVAINVSPGYHYLFTEELNRQRQPVRNHFSISFGLACLF